MNQFYRALHMPPKRLLRKVMGEKEIYTIAVRPRPTAEGTEPLPALEGGPYTLLPRREGWWFADPLLYHRRGKRWLFAEAMDLSTGKGRLEVCELHDDGTADDNEPDHLYRIDITSDSNAHVYMEKVFDEAIKQGEIEGLCVDPSTGDLLVHMNRGARIVLGMGKGFYPGYTEEVHEIYRYSMEAKQPPRR